MKKYCTVLLFIPMLTACLKGTLIPDVKQEGWKTGGIYLLHDNPKPGDFAVYHVVGRSVVGGTVELNYYWEGTKTVDIIAINNGILTIREYYTTDRLRRDGGSRLMQVSPSPPVLRDIRTTPDGRIVEIKVNGVKQQIAVKGENGYMEFSELGDSIPVEVDGGKYSARPSYCQARRGYSVKSCLVN